MIFNRNAIWAGAMIGLAIPFTGFAVLQLIFEQLEAMGWATGKGFSPNFRTRTLAVIAIALNIIPINIFQKKRYIESMRGVAIVTAAYAIAWLIYFGKELL